MSSRVAYIDYVKGLVLTRIFKAGTITKQWPKNILFRIRIFISKYADKQRPFRIPRIVKILASEMPSSVFLLCIYVYGI